MNKRLLFPVLAALLLLAGCSQGGKVQVSQQAEKTREALAQKKYTIGVGQALPARGRAVNLNSNYSLTVSGDSVYSHLPYFGRAYNVPYGGGSGLVFDAPITGYTVKEGRKGLTEVSFEARTGEDWFRFNIRVSPGGGSYISVLPGQREAISFDGRMQ